MIEISASIFLRPSQIPLSRCHQCCDTQSGKCPATIRRANFGGYTCEAFTWALEECNLISSGKKNPTNMTICQCKSFQSNQETFSRLPVTTFLPVIGFTFTVHKASPGVSWPLFGFALLGFALPLVRFSVLCLASAAQRFVFFSVFFRLGPSFGLKAVPNALSSGATPIKIVGFFALCPKSFMKKWRNHGFSLLLTHLMRLVWKNKLLLGCSTIHAIPSMEHIAQSSATLSLTRLPSLTVSKESSPYGWSARLLVTLRDSHTQLLHCGPIITRPTALTLKMVQMVIARPSSVQRFKWLPKARSRAAVLSPRSSDQRATLAFPAKRSTTWRFLTTVKDKSSSQRKSFLTKEGKISTMFGGTWKKSSGEGLEVYPALLQSA